MKRMYLLMRIQGDRYRVVAHFTTLIKLKKNQSAKHNYSWFKTHALYFLVKQRSQRESHSQTFRKYRRDDL